MLFRSSQQGALQQGLDTLASSGFWVPSLLVADSDAGIGSVAALVHQRDHGADSILWVRWHAGRVSAVGCHQQKNKTNNSGDKNSDGNLNKESEETESVSRNNSSATTSVNQSAAAAFGNKRVAKHVAKQGHWELNPMAGQRY